MDRRHRLLARLPLIGGGVLVLLLVLGLVWLIHGVMAGKQDKKERSVQVVTVVRPPPPPPDEPPPPPPEVKDEPLPQDEPEPTPSDEPSPAEQLGLDADGAAGGDAFGLAARKGGRDITGSGGAVFAWYTGMIKDAMLDALSADARVRAKKFTVTVKVWVEPDGSIRTARLANSSGNRELDQAIEAALLQAGRVREAPPVEMPQPVSLRIVSRS